MCKKHLLCVEPVTGKASHHNHLEVVHNLENHNKYELILYLKRTKANILIPTVKLLFIEDKFINHFVITDNNSEKQVFFSTLYIRKVRVK